MVETMDATRGNFQVDFVQRFRYGMATGRSIRN
jgi:hypothetical protein